MMAGERYVRDSDRGTVFVVTSRTAELVAAGLAEIPDPPDDLPESMVRLTPEGMAWVTRARTASVAPAIPASIADGDQLITTSGPVSTSPETGPGSQWKPASPGWSGACGPHCVDGHCCDTAEGPASPETGPHLRGSDLLTERGPAAVDQCCPAYPNCHEPVPGPLVAESTKDGTCTALCDREPEGEHAHDCPNRETT